jgi:hypothetical protein
MSVTITIQGTPIEFPSSGESPNWAPAVIEFAQATEQALLSAVGPYDIAPQVFNLISDVNTNLDITDLNFPTSVVRAGYINYSVVRVGTVGLITTTLSEAGNITVVYDGSAWTLTRDYVGDADCTFNITSAGQVRITTPTLAGYSSGKVSFSAQTLQQS